MLPRVGHTQLPPPLLSPLDLPHFGSMVAEMGRAEAVRSLSSSGCCWVSFPLTSAPPDPQTFSIFSSPAQKELILQHSRPDCKRFTKMHVFNNRVTPKRKMSQLYLIVSQLFFFLSLEHTLVGIQLFKPQSVFSLIYSLVGLFQQRQHRETEQDGVQGREATHNRWRLASCSGSTHFIPHVKHSRVKVQLHL